MTGEHEDLAVRTFVDVHAIQEELEQVRWGLSDDGEFSEAAQHAANEARASVCNLITVVSSEKQLQGVTEILDGLSVTQASRTLILLAQHDRLESKLEAEVSAQTRTESGHRVSTEKVLLHAHGEVARHLGSMVAPLVIPDLPVMLWWPGRPDFDNPLFDDLCKLADRLIVDTDEEFSPADMERLLQTAQREEGKVSIGDFNWARLIPWRHLTAQFFDMPGMLPRLSRIHGATVYHGRDGSTTQARLLGGWIRGRLASAGIDVPVELHADDGHEHGISQFLIYADGGPDRTRFSVSHRPGGRLCAEIREGEHDHVARTVRLTRRSPEELLAIELTLPGRDVLFEEAVAATLR